MDCPRCKTGLIVIEVDQIELDYCVTCGGTWLDSGEMELLAAKAGAHEQHIKLRPTSDTREKRLRCPSCGSRMDKRIFGESAMVLVDVCPSCGGMWLDKNELEEIIEQVGRGMHGNHGAIGQHLHGTFRRHH
jgi:Zn-finger nucleic acid-binding protein